MARDTIRFVLNGADVSVAPTDPTMTLLDYVRLQRRLTGTKEGCAEGDCGACTVLVGKLVGGELRYEAVNACIQLLASVDRRAIVTVEALKTPDGALHPIQRAMVDLHASQCGFCTPGIVMSLTALWLNHDAPPSKERIEDALAGNLCRCTGYGPIIDAVARAYASAKSADDPLRRERADVARRLKALASLDALSFVADGRRYCAPTNPDDLAAAAQARPDAIILAGATDAGLWITKDMRKLASILWVGDVADFDAIENDGGVLSLGAGASLTACRAALGAMHPEIDEMLRRFGSEQIRNVGTIGGSIANASPIGDLAPVLIALGATLVLRLGDGRRTMPIEAFFLDYKKQDRKPGEIVESILVTRPPKGALLHVSKISKRFDEDITSVLGAFQLVRDKAGIVTEARLAFGGMAAIPKRAAKAEAALVGRPFDAAAAEAAATALAEDFTPLDDWRASAAYRAKVAANLIRRFFAETEAGARLRVVIPYAEAAHA